MCGLDGTIVVLKPRQQSVSTLYKQELKENDTIRYLTSAFYGAKFMLNTYMEVGI